MAGNRTPPPKILVLPDPETLHREAAERITRAAERAVAASGRFAWALSGGTTPGPVYRLLAAPPFHGRVPWNAVHLFWADERCVPPDDPESNHRLVQETLLERVSIPEAQVHRIPGELDPQAAAHRYAATLREALGPGEVRFDLVSLGLGRDGHTAALFPGSPALHAPHELVVASSGDYAGRPADRVTLTLRAINATAQVLFFVRGADKAEAVRAVLEAQDETLPAAHVRPADGQVVWLLDRAAAGRLTAVG